MWYDTILHENGYTVCPPDWGLAGELAGYHRVYYVKGGTCDYASKTKSFRLQRERLYLFPTFHEYDMAHDPADPLDVLWFHIEIFPGIQNDVIDIDISDNPMIGSLLHALFCIMNDEGEGEEKRVLIDLLLHYMERQVPFNRVSEQRLSDMAQYIRNNLSADLSIHALAGRALMERSYFSRLFRKSFGVSPQQYVIATRMIGAAQLLKTDYTIAQISELVGYGNEKAFSAAFAKHWGAAPSIFRKSHIYKP